MESLENRNRGNWGSKFGFIMAAASSAVGLGNIWRFPYVTGENGGSAFILIYLAFVFIIGISIMIAELSLGRRAGMDAVGTFKRDGKKWSFIGILGTLSAFLIMGFYPVIGGWSVAYIVKSFGSLLSDAALVGDKFGAFITNPWEPLLWLFLYLGMTMLVVSRGISDGIEKVSKVLMPTILVLLAFIAIRGFFFEGAKEGLDFFLKPDFSKVSGDTFLAALGHSFFTLSLGMGIMVTYGSYLKKEEHIVSNAAMITILDTCVALLAGIAMFPAIFAFGLAPDAGPGLVFIVLPTVFAEIGGVWGVLLSVVFFLALTVAALTSTVSLLEVLVSYLIDEKKMSRKKAVTVSGICLYCIAVVSSLSLGAVDIKLLGASFFDILDILTDKIFLSVCGMFVAIYVGWFVDKKEIFSEITNKGSVPFALINVWYFLIKYIIPIAICIVSVSGIMAIEQTGVAVLGVLIIIGLAGYFLIRYRKA